MQVPPPTVPTLSATASSNSARTTRKRALAIFQEFQVVRPGQPYSTQPWEDLPEAVVCDRKMYEDFAAYMLSEYTFQASSKRKHLDSSTALPYLNNLLHAAEDKYGLR